MQNRLRFAATAAICVCAQALSACSGGWNPGTSAPAGETSTPLTALAPSHPSSRFVSWIAKDAAKAPLAYVADAGNNVIDIYSRVSLKLVGQLTTNVAAPVGLAIGPDGSLYVASVHPQDILVYAKGATRPKRVLYDTNQPSAVAVGSDGTVYAATDSTLASNVTGVDIFPKGYVAPQRTITDSHYVGMWAVAVDASGNLYIGGEGNSGTGLVEKYAPGARTGTSLKLKQLVFPTSIVLNGNDLLIADFHSGTFNMYPAGASSPSFQIHATNVAYIAREPHADRVWAPTYDSNVVNIVSYPSGSTVGSITVPGAKAALTGVALSP